MSYHIIQSINDLQNDRDYAVRYVDQLRQHIELSTDPNDIYHLKIELSNVVNSVHCLNSAIQI